MYFTRASHSLLAFSIALSAQAPTWVSVPKAFEDLPGNAAISQPLRWSQGILQAHYDAAVTPDALRNTTIKRVRVRRPGFVNEPAYPAITLTFQLSLGTPTKFATSTSRALADNRPANLTLVVPATSYSVPATSPHGAGDAVGGDIVDLPLTTPYAYGAVNVGIFLEWETIAPTFQVSATHWVDAIYSAEWNDRGMSVAVGNGGCGSVASARPMTLVPADETPPQLGQSVRLLLAAARPNARAWTVFGIDPNDRYVLPFAHGSAYGADLAPLGAPGCFNWTTFDLWSPLTTSALGTASVSIALPNDPNLKSRRLGVQVFAEDAAANAARYAVSNGVVVIPDQVGVLSWCSCVTCPGAGCTISPFSVYIGSAPIVLLGS